MSNVNRYLKTIREEGKADPESRYTIQSDKWDKWTARQLEQEMKELDMATTDLTKITETGTEAMRDTLLSILKTNPKLKDSDKVRPSYHINASVMQEMYDLKTYEQLHNSSVGDPVMAGLSAASIEPELEVLFEKLENEREQAEQLEQLLLDYEQAVQDENLSDEEMESRLDELEQQIQNNFDELAEAMKGQGNQIAKALNDGIKDAQDKADTLKQAESWGFEPPKHMRVDPSVRLALAERVNTPTFKRIADLFGRLSNAALTEQRKKLTYEAEEIYDLQQGSDLVRVLPFEIMMASEEILFFSFAKKLMEQDLLQYSLRSKEEMVVKGGIILLRDVSSSMAGPNDEWATAISLALLKVAQTQKRSLDVITFSSALGPHFHFDTEPSPIEMTVDDKKVLYGLEAVLAYASYACAGGTDFNPPFQKALDVIDTEYAETGAVEADIVFLTDGYGTISEEVLNRLCEAQKEMGFDVFGISLSANPTDQIKKICEGKVIHVTDLQDVDLVRNVFRKL